MIYLLWWLSYVLDIFVPCMLSNPCRCLVESNSMRLRLTHILSNLYITKSLYKGGWRQGSTKPFKHILWKILCWVSWLSFWIHKCSSLQELTHVGRWTQTPSGAPNSWWATSTLSTHTSSTTWARTTPPPKVCYSILEKLYSKTWVKATQQDVNTSRCLNEKW